MKFPSIRSALRGLILPIGALPLVLPATPAPAAGLLDSLQVRFYRHQRLFPTPETIQEPEYRYLAALLSHAPGCGKLAIDTAAVVPGPESYNSPVLRLVVSRTTSSEASCSTWRRQRVLAPVAEGGYRAYPSQPGELYGASLKARIVLAGSRDSVEFFEAWLDTAHFQVLGGRYPKPVGIPGSCAWHCQEAPAPWGFSYVSPDSTASLKRRIDTARTAGIRFAGEGVWLPASTEHMHDSLRLEAGAWFTQLRVNPWSLSDAVERPARHLRWEKILHGDTAGAPSLAVRDSRGGPWRVRFQGGRGGSDSIVGDTLRLAGPTTEIELAADVEHGHCPSVRPSALLLASGTRWLDLRMTDRPLASIDGPQPQVGMQWILMRHDSLISVSYLCFPHDQPFIGTLESVISSSISPRDRAAALPRALRSGDAWQLELPASLGSRLDVEVHTLTGRTLLALHNIPSGRVDLGALPAADGVLLVRVRGDRHSASLRLPAIR